jgi:hypothetical protein
MSRAVVNVPKSVKRGEIFEVRTLVAHAMETGFRRTQLGELIPRDIITRFVCTYNGGSSRRPSRDRREPPHRVHDRRDGERDARVPVDRRQGLLADRVGDDHGCVRIPIQDSGFRLQNCDTIQHRSP